MAIFLITCFSLLAGFSAQCQTIPHFSGEPAPFKLLNSPEDETSYVFMSNHSGFITRKKSGLSQFSSQVLKLEKGIITIDDRFSKGNVYTHVLGINKNNELTWAELTERQGIYWIEIKSESGIESFSFRDKSSHLSGCLSMNGKHILLSMESNVSYGVEDIYIVHRNSDGTWGELRNMGYAVNTAFQEITPFLAADDATLYFASNGYTDSFGSFDLYVSTRLDDTWQQWSAPVNLGPSVNTKGAESSFFLLPGDSTAYFISTTDSDGYGDIKKISLEKPLYPSTAIKDDQVIYFSVKDEKTKTELRADIEIMRAGQTLVQKLKGGQSYAQVSPADLSLTIKYPGYLPLDTIIFSDQPTYEFFLRLAEKGSLVALKNVLFFQGSSTMIPGSERELNSVVEFLQENISVKIELRGHTDNQGDPVLNMELSRQRVTAIQTFLVERGIATYRITTRGFGGNLPIAPNDTESNRAKNRRVEFAIIEN